ncbi:MAG: DUF4982 domain-containing protein [Solobacterium sp.]|nr:DUF4982 domain-containing protein [Solobacterium sp.]
MKKVLFNENWKLNGETVTLPRDEMFLTARTADSKAGDAQGFFQGGSYVYEKEMGVDASFACLKFDGVYKNAKVYLNGEKKIDVPYGYSPFTAELGAVKRSDIVRVECDNADQPDSRWYSGAGIYRNVYLYTADGEHILPNGVRIDTLDYSVGLIRVRVNVTAGEAEIAVLDGDRICAEGKGNDIELTVKDAKTWDAEEPNLYTCRVRLGDDEETVRFGIRQIEKRSDGLFVNGKNVLLKGGCVHHDSGLLGAATFKKSEYRRMRILKEGGYNAIRSAHNPASEEMLNACDELGLYVMDETWDMWYNHKSKYDYASVWSSHYRDDIRRLVERDYNHPSVILYSIGNEISEPAAKKGIDAAKEMVDLFHELDPNRLVTGGFNLMIITNAYKGKAVYNAEEGGRNTDTEKTSGMNSTLFNLLTSLVGSGMNKAANSKKSDELCSPSLDFLDVAGYNYASGRYPLDAKLHPNRIIVGSETMCYDIAKNWAVVEKLPTLAGDFMWTAWDYLGENGIGAWSFEKDGKGFSKPYPWWLADTGAYDILGDPNAEADWAKATWHASDKPLIDVQPFNHPNKAARAVWRGTNGLPSYSWRGCTGKKAVVEVFFDCARIDLYLNGRKIKSAKVKENRAKFRITYIPGTIEAVAYDQAGMELARNSLVSARDDLRPVLHPEDTCVRENEIVYIPVRIEDEDGILECSADRRLKIEVENGELLAFGSANPRLTEDIRSGEYTTYYGRALAVVRAGKAGTMKVSVEDQSAEIKVEA